MILKDFTESIQKINNGESVEKLLDVTQLCELLGVKPAWVYEMVRKGVIPYVRLGKLLRFRPEKIEEWLDELGAGPIEEPEECEK